jgi:prepilin-type N-terminal cleavage/methylation domain-containing protein
MRQGTTGFALVELLIVMVILGLVATFAAPRIDITRFKVNSAVQALGTTVLTAQRQAVTQQHDVIMLFDTTYNRIHIHEDRNNDGDVDAPAEHVRVVPLGESIVFGRGPAPQMSTLTGDGVVIAKRIGGVPAIVFHRDGSASEVGGFYVTSVIAKRGEASRATDARAVTVERATGRASWFRYSPNGWVKLF